MPIHASKHTEETLFEIRDFSGGMNVSYHPGTLAPNECVNIENFFLDPVNGKLRGRYPFVLMYYDSDDIILADWATNGAPAPFKSIYYWNGYWLFEWKGSLYYLDVSGGLGLYGYTTASLGALSGSGKPYFCPYNNRLIVASGGNLQYTTFAAPPAALATVTNAPKGNYIFSKDGRLVVGGDPDNPDRIWQCAVQNETSWAAGTDDYADVGWKDQLTVNGCCEFADGLFMVSKTGNQGRKAYFLTSLTEAAPKCSLVSDTHVPMSNGGLVECGGKIYIMERKYVSKFIGTDAQGKIVVDLTPGAKICSVFTATSTGTAAVFPDHQQVWFLPANNGRAIWVCHYARNDAWTKFTVTESSAPYIHSISDIHYCNADGYMYIAAVVNWSNTGAPMIMRYDTLSGGCDDFAIDGSGTASPRRVWTGVIDPNITREKIVKRPLFFYSTLNGGSATMSLYDQTGTVQSATQTVTLASPGTKLSSLNATYLYDTRLGGTAELFLGSQSGVDFSVMDVNAVVDNFQFRLDVNTGNIVLDAMAATVALGRNKV